MTRTSVVFAVGVLLSGCGDLPTTTEGVAFLEIRPPTTTTLTVGDSVQFTARALDREGLPLEVAVLWRTPDTTITVGETTGVVTGLLAGTGRVQAVIGDNELVSTFVSLTIVEPPAPNQVLRRP